MIKKRYLLLLAVALFAFGCSKAGSGSGGLAYDDSTSTYFERQRTPGLGYDNSSTSWHGSGYNPEGPAGVEGQTPPAYKDMSNLVGQVSDGNASVPETSPGDAAERKLVKRADLSIRVENLDEADASITALMEKHGAYAALTEARENSSRQYSIRVPSSEYDAFFAGMSGMGRILRRTEFTEDVTVRYYDLEGRLATKKELLKTFQSYLGKAKNIEEILSVERRLADLQNEIDGTGRELRSLANRVDYATIDLTLLGPVTSTPDRDSTLGERIKELFGAFGGFLSTIAVIIIGIVIYGVPILLLLALFFWLFFGKMGLLKKLWQIAAGKKNEK
jgi:hypothetical protein